MRRRRVAIIGAGFSGVALAAQLTRRRGGPDIALVERAGRVGPGLAYSTRDPAHLLNVRASRMSAFADRPDDFLKWLRAHGMRQVADPFARRAAYGDYIEHILGRARVARPFGGFKRMHGEAVACQREGEDWRISLSDGRTLLADAAVLAIGHPPPRAPEALTRAGVAVIDAWDEAALRQISPKADVLVVGTGLSMVDVTLTLSSRRRTGIIYALSRRGLTPRPQPRALPSGAVEPMSLPAGLSNALHAFRAEIERMAARGEPWQLAFDRIRKDTPDLWQRLSAQEQSRFLRHLRPWWDVHRHRAAPEISERISELLSKGRLRVFAGEIVSVSSAAGSVLVSYRQRGGLARHRLEVAHVINCTGADNRPGHMDAPLPRQMLAEGIVRPHRSGLGFDVDEQGRIISAAGEVEPGLYALGPVVQGAFWETTAVPEIRARAAALAELICVR